MRHDMCAKQCSRTWIMCKFTRAGIHFACAAAQRGCFSRLSTAQPAEPCACSPCRSECANIGQDQQTARASRPVDPIARWLARLELATYSMPPSGAYTVILYAFQRDANKPRDGWLSTPEQAIARNTFAGCMRPEQKMRYMFSFHIR